MQLIRFSLFAFLLLTQSSLATVDAQHRLSEKAAELPNVRPTVKTWNPHALVAGMWDRINGPHNEKWSERAPDLFEAELAAIRNRLQDYPKNIDEPELLSIKNRLDRLEAAQNILINRLEDLKNQTADSASPVEKKKLEDVITALQLRLQAVLQVQTAFKGRR